MDTIANALSTIKNCAMSGRKSAEVYHSNVLEDVLKLMKERGFLDDVKVFKAKDSSAKRIHVDIAFEGGVPKISEIKKISKPGRREYRKRIELKRVIGGYGLAVVSTSRGIMSEDDAKKKRLGGEIICEVS